MNGGGRARSSSLSGDAQVTLQVAKNDKSGNKTRTIKASEVRGFTQAEETQRPTVYARELTGSNWTKDWKPSGRVTQEHNKPENVGAHFQHGREINFGNVPRDVMDFAQKSNAPKDSPLHQNSAELANWSVEYAKAHPSLNPNVKQQLVEVFGNDSGQLTGSHKSRSNFVDLTSHGNHAARADLIKSLQSGPLNVKSLSRQAEGSHDDWHVRQSSTGKFKAI